MGALVSVSQRDDVRAQIARARSGRRADRRRRSRCRAAGRRAAPSCRRSCCAPTIRGARARSTTVEAFGPVSTIMPYRDIDDAIALANRGMGSLALSLFTHSPDAAREFVQGAAAYHGRMLVLDRDQCRGIDRPRLAAAGARPWRPRPRRRQRGDGRRARREALHAAHRAPVVAGDDRRDHRAIHSRRAQACHRRPPVPPEDERARHRRHAGRPAAAPSRIEDIEHFAEFTGDKFYAHMDEEAAKASPIFEGRVAHGYLILSFAAGLFVDPDPGPGARQYRPRESALPDPALSRAIRCGSS